MIEQLQDLVNSDAALVRRGRWMNARMLLGIGSTQWLVTIRAGRIEEMTSPDLAVTEYDFAISAPRDAWAKYWQKLPPPMHHDMHALIRAKKMTLAGDIDRLLANMLYLKILLEKLRGKV